MNVTRKLKPPLLEERAENRVRDLSKLPLVRTDECMVLAAIARSRASSFSFWDALIVEAALKGGADRLLTEDLQHGQVIGGMRIEDPFLRFRDTMVRVPEHPRGSAYIRRAGL